MYSWWLWAHLVSVGGFLMAHGFSAVMGFRLRRESSPDAIRSLTGLSQRSSSFTYGFIILILITGIAMGFQQNWWRFAWIWIALGVLLVTIGAMNGLNRPYQMVRAAVGLPPRGRGPAPTPVSSEQLQQVVARANEWPISIFGIVAILVLIWLMVLKPF